MNRKSIIVIVLLSIGVLGLGNFTAPVFIEQKKLFNDKIHRSEEDYSNFIDMLRHDELKTVSFFGSRILAETSKGYKFKTIDPGDPGLVGELLDHKEIDVKGNLPPKKKTDWLITLLGWFPMLLMIGVWIYFMRGQGNQGAKKFGGNKAKLIAEEDIKTTFADVAGIEEAQYDVEQIKRFLIDPKKYFNMGAKIPRGALMVGPPGTGKTLLARAIAGEAKVPFFTISGSDFVEMFVGVGASRVRDMFEQAKKQAPCIIFIDEIDAVGRTRGTGMGGGHDEREQTLNQILVEMDGFSGNEGIVVIAATNREDVLDPALLRPGRFDRIIQVGLPDVRGRAQILKVHLKKILTAADINPMQIARGTPGFSGAEMGHIANEAAIDAADNDHPLVTMEHLEEAKDKKIMGGKKKNMVLDDFEKKMTAYHEAGHCIVGRLVPEHDPVYKVSIMPRGRALGVTLFLPDGDKHSYSKKKLNSSLQAMYGGRIAEELIFGSEEVTTGAENDIERASEIARNMVTKWGLSDNLGAINYDNSDPTKPFAGMQAGMGSQGLPISPETLLAIDTEVRKIIDTNYNSAKKILTDNKDILHSMSKALLKWETIDAKQIDALMSRKKRIPRPGNWSMEELKDMSKTK